MEKFGKVKKNLVEEKYVVAVKLETPTLGVSFSDEFFLDIVYLLMTKIHFRNVTLSNMNMEFTWILMEELEFQK